VRSANARDRSGQQRPIKRPLVLKTYGEPLRLLTTKAGWKKFEDVKADYGAADRVGQFTVFDIGGNKWRIIAAIHYNRRLLFIRYVLTHEEYSRGRWKE